MTRAEHIRHVFALFDDDGATMPELIDACVAHGVFTADEVQRRGLRSVRATCARALRAKDEATGLRFAYPPSRRVLYSRALARMDS
jgi:hypothetical protein